MKTTSNPPFTFKPALPGQPLPRELFITLLNSAISVKEIRFARQASLVWLTSFPGDLPVNLLYARALILDNRPELAAPILDELTQLDPEYLEAAELLSTIRSLSKTQAAADSLAWVTALRGNRAGTQTEALYGAPEQTIALWSKLVSQARAFLEQGNLGQAEQVMHQALAAKPANPLVAATHLKILHAQAIAKNTPNQSLRSLAEHYHEIWPNCLQCGLLLADVLMDGGESEKAVALLHHSAARDITGQVAKRLWGDNHPYRVLWPDTLEAALDLPVPAGVAAAMGWNRLPTWGTKEREPEPAPAAEPSPSVEIPPTSGEPTGPADSDISETQPITTAQSKTPEPHTAIPSHEPLFSSVPESLRSVQAELERVAGRLNQSSLVRSDGRFPVYVVMTTRRGLESVYGPEYLPAIEAEMKKLVQAVQSRKDWKATLFYADEGTAVQGNTVKFLVPPARPNDPWGLKLALVDLDTALGHKGEMIGALLIVGGPEVVPFHNLPNPVDDSDAEVSSDNPYGTRDENYFIPEWPIGRLPGGVNHGISRGNADPNPLLDALRILTTRHAEQAKRTRQRRWLERVMSGVKARLSGIVRSRRSFGYTAAVWRNASFSVFHPIGQPEAMLVSPPTEAMPPTTSHLWTESGAEADPASNGSETLKSEGQKTATSSRRSKRFKGKPRKRVCLVPATKLAYFNLHGLEDAVEWYGQSDPRDDSVRASDGPDYPVALRPEDIRNHGQAPQVVFSEACYGAHILGKTVEEAMALKFLQSGSQAVVGCTCTAYGSVDSPLIAADFLGQSFWDNLRKGMPAGEALRRAKIALANEMHRRQGYLDGEDQKTLISFVLYGDPLAQPLGPGSSPKAVLRPLAPPPAVKTICDRSRNEDSVDQVPPEVLAHVKRVVEQYLPGMADGQLSINQEHADCDHAGHECPTAQLGKKFAPVQNPKRRLIILSKQVAGFEHIHRHYARITLDDHNQLVKLVVSR